MKNIIKFEDFINEGKKDKYSVSFEQRQSIGNYDRSMTINKDNQTPKQIYNLLYKTEYGNNGYYIRGSIKIKKDGNVIGTIDEFDVDMNIEKEIEKMMK